MPFSVRGNKKDGYRLFNTDKKEFAKRTFKTREAAENMKKSYMKHKHDGRKKVPPGHHRMPDGSIMSDDDPRMKKGKKKKKY
tara:strand:+ start:259 stop:504 length:246 start_codon:yes stop_codon:yes gene_type:complete